MGTPSGPVAPAEGAGFNGPTEDSGARGSLVPLPPDVARTTAMIASAATTPPVAIHAHLGQAGSDGREPFDSRRLGACTGGRGTRAFFANAEPA
jgi:hypothetical protein